MKTLDISNNGIGDVGLSCIAKSLSKNTTLNTLIFGCNNSSNSNSFTSKSLSQLTVCLKNNSSLKKLKFSGICLDEASVTQIGNLLTNNVLVSLNLSHCYIGISGAIELSKALSLTKSLQYLNLSHNNIKDQGAIAISKAIYNNNIFLINSLYLSLKNNEIGDKGASAFSNVLSTYSIWWLYMNNNNIGDIGALSICEGLKLGKSNKNNFLFLMSLKLNQNISPNTIEVFRKLCNEKQNSFFDFYVTFYGSLD